jgi:hypothetical protein
MVESELVHIVNAIWEQAEETVCLVSWVVLIDKFINRNLQTLCQVK